MPDGFGRRHRRRLVVVEAGSRVAAVVRPRVRPCSGQTRPRVRRASPTLWRCLLYTSPSPRDAHES
eukprot:364345-Prymnesium_polylepis.1